MNNDRFKFRYVFNTHKEKGIVIEYHSIEDIEKGSLDWMHIKSQQWELLSREQCTGLKDKNGTLIFEGDIVRERMFDGEYWHASVKWLDAEYSRCTPSGWFVGKDDLRLCQYRLKPIDCETKYEVIGNIHENGDLLK